MNFDNFGVFVEHMEKWKKEQVENGMSALPFVQIERLGLDEWYFTTRLKDTVTGELGEIEYKFPYTSLYALLFYLTTYPENGYQVYYTRDKELTCYINVTDKNGALVCTSSLPDQSMPVFPYSFVVFSFQTIELILKCPYLCKGLSKEDRDNLEIFTKEALTYPEFSTRSETTDDKETVFVEVSFKTKQGPVRYIVDTTEIFLI